VVHEALEVEPAAPLTAPLTAAAAPLTAAAPSPELEEEHAKEEDDDGVAGHASALVGRAGDGGGDADEDATIMRCFDVIVVYCTAS
jgi:hypothetical protein